MARMDLTGEQWLCLRAVLHELPVMGRKPWDRRQVFNGIWWRARTGSPCRDVPERYGPWGTLYSVFRCWQIDDTWVRSLTKLQGKADAVGHIEWEVSVDSTISRAPPSTTPEPTRGGCQSWPDESGRTGGRAGRPRTRPLARRPDHQVHLAVDASSRRPAADIRALDPPTYWPTAPTPLERSASTCAAGRSLRPFRRSATRPAIADAEVRAGVRPPGFDREKYKARHKVECRIGLLKQARGVATRYENLAVRYEATIQPTLIRQAL
ncbi:transposase [Streptomyces sp. H62]